MDGLRAFNKNTQGVSAIEFALIAPVMMVIMLGSISTYHLVRASMKLWDITQSVSDLVSQQQTLTAAEMTDICTSTSLSKYPFTGTLKVAVASVTHPSTGATAIDWQDTTCGSGTAISNALALGAAYTPDPKDSVIIAKSTYVYTFPPSYVLPSSITLTRTTYSKPRDGTQVSRG